VDLVDAAVQLHHVLAAEQSTEVPDEHEHRGPVSPEGPEHDRAALRVEDGHLREIIGAGRHGPVIAHLARGLATPDPLAPTDASLSKPREIIVSRGGPLVA
jgi:hypothetical protein